MSSTDVESEEVEERDPSPRVSYTESPNIKELLVLNSKDPSETLLKKESVEDSETSVSSTHTGLVKTLPTNSSKSFSLILHTKPSREMLKLTGFADLFTNTENLEVSLPLVRNTEVLREREETTIRTDLQEELTGREETKLSLEDTDNLILMFNIKICF